MAGGPVQRGATGCNPVAIRARTRMNPAIVAGGGWVRLKNMTRLRKVYPGEVLREEFLIPLGMTAYPLAQRIGVPQTRISEILHGGRAALCSGATGCNPVASQTRTRMNPAGCLE